MNSTKIYDIPNINVTKFLMFFVKKYKLNFFLISFFAVLVNVSSNTVWPYIMGELVDAFDIIDSSKEGKSLELVMPFLMWAILYWVISTLAHSLKGFMFGITRPKFCAEIRMSLFDLVMHHRHNYFIHKHIGDVSQRIAELPRSAQLITDNIMTVFLPLIISVIVSVASFIHLNSVVSMLFAAFLVTYVGITITMGNHAAKHCDAQYKSFSELFGSIVDSIRNNFNVRIFSGLRNEKNFIQQYQNREMKAARKAYFFIENLKIVLGLLEITSVIGILWVSILLWQKNELSVGDLIFIANSIFNVMSFMWFAVDEITYTFNEIGICRQGLTLLQDESNQNVAFRSNTNKKNINVTKGEIEFHGVSFKYRDGAKLFDSKSLKIHGGEKIGLVGFSGSGKTTFAHLIMGLYDVNEGYISIDGQNISEVSMSSLRRNISFIQQEPLLFHRSIMENIRYGKLEATDEEVIDAAIKAHAHDFIIHMPNGYDQQVGEMGGKLSGGQKQRIAIARAILRNAPILIMDEATSALDSITEKKIQESLKYLMENKTVIVIAHRLSTVLHMDKIMLFNKGKVVEIGTHAELLQKNGYYRTLWNMQQDGLLPNEQCED